MSQWARIGPDYYQIIHPRFDQFTKYRVKTLVITSFLVWGIIQYNHPGALSGLIGQAVDGAYQSPGIITVTLIDKS
jgi:hypothetical protein